MAAISTNDPKLSAENVTLLRDGTRAVVAAPVLAFASLADGQTFVTITPAGAVDSRTINAALAASTDRPTFCAALVAELNTAGTTAYVWSVNGTGDGLIGTAKASGSAFDIAPTGTCLIGGTGSNATKGVDSYDYQVQKVAGLAPAGWLDRQQYIFSKIAAGVSTVVPIPFRDLSAVKTGIGDAHIDGGGSVVQTNGLWVGPYPLSPYLFQNAATVPFGFAFRVKLPVPVTGRYVMIGMSNSVTQFCVVVSYYDHSVPARTKLMLIGSNGTTGCSLDSGVTIDANLWMDVAVGWDLVNLTLAVNGAIVGAIPAASARLPGASGSAASLYVRASDAAASAYITDGCYAF